MQNTQQTPKILLVISIIVCLVVFGFISPIPQDAGYHSFANEKSMFGINNFMNVVSNFGFILSGIYGFWLILKYKIKNPISYALFAGMIMTGLGSAYYHYNPTNHTLVWDRMPMTIVFTSFFAQLYVWYFSYKIGLNIWIFSLLTGIFSVFYWQYTESVYKGDLRLYAIVQFLPILLILVILGLNYKKNTVLLKPMGFIVSCYALAKIVEHFDYQLFELTKSISGHPVKHVIASVATLYIVITVRNFTLKQPPIVANQ